MTPEQIKQLQSIPECYITKYLVDPAATYREYSKLAADLFPGRMDGKTILDIGCGAPYFLLAAKQLAGLTPLGLDNLPASIEAAGILDVPIVKATLSANTETPPNAPYDVITMFRCNVTGEAPGPIQAKIVSWLKRPGLLVVSMNTGEHPSYHDPKAWGKYAAVTHKRRGRVAGGDYHVFTIG